MNALASRPASIVDEVEAMKNAKDGDMGNGWLTRNSAGSGPFVLRAWRAGEGVTLEANPTHFPRCTENAAGGAAPCGGSGRAAADDRERRRRYCAQPRPDQIAGLAGKPDVAIENYPQAAIHFLSFNIKHDKLKDPALWEALRWLIDYDGIATTLLRGQMKVHQAFWPSGFAGSVEDRPYKLDVAKAKDILAKANIPPGSPSIWM